LTLDGVAVTEDDVEDRLLIAVRVESTQVLVQMVVEDTEPSADEPNVR